MEDLEEELVNQMDKVWGQECMVDMQCAKVSVMDLEIQISVCDNRQEFSGDIKYAWDESAHWGKKFENKETDNNVVI